jgi:hypothetical protein
MCGLGAITDGTMAGIIILMVIGQHHHGLATVGLKGIGKITEGVGIGYQAIGGNNTIIQRSFSFYGFIFGPAAMQAFLCSKQFVKIFLWHSVSCFNIVINKNSTYEKDICSSNGTFIVIHIGTAQPVG